jgi:hypothetical protein
MRKLRIAFAALALTGAAAPFVAACDDPDTIGEQIDEAGEEIGDEIDDHTDDE